MPCVFTESLSLNGNALTGTIPSEMGSLSSIQELRFDSNSIIGTIPDEFENLKNISKYCRSFIKVFQSFLGSYERENVSASSWTHWFFFSLFHSLISELQKLLRSVTT